MLMFRRLAPLLLGAALLGCDDSTGPGAVDLHLAARSFESLGQTRMSSGDGGGATVSRLAAQALRTGLRPARVRIAVDGITEEYWALEVEHALGADLTADPNDAPILTLPIVARTMVAWRGAPAERVIAITISSDTGMFGVFRFDLELPPPYPIYLGPAFGIMFERGGPVHFAVDGGARSTRQTIGAECRIPPRPAFMELVWPVTTPTTCRFATFFTRFNMRAQEGPPAGAAAVRVRVITMDGHDIPGLRFEYPWLYRPCAVCD
ncbi:MAG TPA: hypothetical protein VJ650_16880 [Gemmatimonadaceae bacterium]|nr:hypothetical protein [Gemmatimonadaceae bacterium]